jgi:HD-GYP domain-containing protein (c-di-GMP phosphodiesterase class II)
MSSNVTTRFKEWQKYRKDLRVFPHDAEDNLELIQDKLRDYRVALAGLEHKSETLDNKIFSSYQKIEDEILNLSQQTNRRPLIINSRRRLETLWLSWKELLGNQDQLLDTLSEAPLEIRRYNDLQNQQEKERIEQDKREEKLEEIENIRESLGIAIEDLGSQDLDRSDVTCGSEILVLGDAKEQWKRQLDYAYDPSSLNLQETEEVLHHFNRLGEVINEAPVMATAVRAVEEKLCQLKDTHESLISMGQGLIPETELARISVMLYEQIPDLWAAGKFSELDDVLQKVDKFISYYQTKIDDVLSIERERRPGLAGVLALNPGNQGRDYQDLIVLARTLVSAVDARDRYMQGHSETVTQYSLKIGRNLNWSQTELEQLELAGLLHDVGKLNIPENILTKTGPLTQHDWSIIQMHPLHSAQIIRPVKRLFRIVPWVLSHQERWDGKGYPDHLAKDDIPLGSSIIAVAEAYTAMTTRSPNRSALSQEEAVENIKRESGKQFNPEVAEAFLDALQTKF